MTIPRAPLFTMARGDEITTEVLDKFIRLHQQVVGRYDYLFNMYINHPEIYTMARKALFKPDNRLAVAFPKYMVDTFGGYFNGIPIKKTHENTDYLEAIAQFDSANDMEDEESELFKLACIYGHSFEYLYQDEYAETKAIYVSPKEMFIVYDNSIEQKPLFAVHYGQNEGSTVGVLVDEHSLREFKSDKGGLKFAEENINPFGKVPVIEFMLNDERQGLFEPVISLINSYNKVMSEKANDVDYFADAYMKILGAELDEKSIERIKDNRIITLHGFDASKIIVEFMDKPDSDAQTEHLLDRAERLIYTTSMVANISDENFGNSSGTALAYKLQAMANLALSVQRKFQSSLNKRYELFSLLRTNVPENMKDEWRNIEYKFTRNEPKNILEEAQTAAQLMGITSQETALSVLSVVSDVSSELNRIDQEQTNTMSAFDFEVDEDG